MICTVEEFLLVVQNWLTDSAKVVLVVTVSGIDPREPALALRAEGRIGTVDLGLPGFAFTRGDGDIVIVNLKEWFEIGYAAEHAYPSDHVNRESIREGFTLSRAGVSISLWALASEDASR